MGGVYSLSVATLSRLKIEKCADDLLLGVLGPLGTRHTTKLVCRFAVRPSKLPGVYPVFLLVRGLTPWIPL
jgi:hypothetical protein